MSLSQAASQLTRDFDTTVSKSLARAWLAATGSALCSVLLATLPCGTGTAITQLSGITQRSSLYLFAAAVAAVTSLSSLQRHSGERDHCA